MRPKQLGNYEVEVYHDKETDAVDEYSVIIDGEDVVGLSEYPNKRGGFNQFAGSLPPKGRVARDQLGERIKWKDAPEGVREAIKDRLEIAEVTDEVEDELREKALANVDKFDDRHADWDDEAWNIVQLTVDTDKYSEDQIDDMMEIVKDEVSA